GCRTQSCSSFLSGRVNSGSYCFPDLSLGHLAEHLDCAVRVSELREQLLIILKAADRMSEQAREPARIFGLRLSEIFHAHLKVLAICIHGPDHDFVTKHKFKIDLVRRDLYFAIATGNTR